MNSFIKSGGPLLIFAASLFPNIALAIAPACNGPIDESSYYVSLMRLGDLKQSLRDVSKESIAQLRSEYNKKQKEHLSKFQACEVGSKCRQLNLDWVYWQEKKFRYDLDQQEILAKKNLDESLNPAFECVYLQKWLGDMNRLLEKHPYFPSQFSGYDFLSGAKEISEALRKLDPKWRFIGNYDRRALLYGWIFANNSDVYEAKVLVLFNHRYSWKDLDLRQNSWMGPALIGNGEAPMEIANLMYFSSLNDGSPRILTPDLHNIKVRDWPLWAYLLEVKKVGENSDIGPISSSDYPRHR